MNISRRQAVGSAGYSMVEVMISLVIALLVMGGLFGMMIQNANVYQAQAQSSDMQQNLRIAMDLMTRDLRSAGRNPTGFGFDYVQQKDVVKCPGVVGLSPDSEYAHPILVAEETRVRVKGDLPVDEGDGAGGAPNGVLDRILESGDRPTNGKDEFGDGCINDSGEDVSYSFESGTLYRVPNGDDSAKQPLSDVLNIVSFAYLDKADSLLTPPVTGDARADIATIRITMLAKASRKDPTLKKFKTYRLVTDVQLRDTGKKVKP